LSGTTRVGRYQKKHSPTHTHPGQHTSFITFLHLQRSRHPLYSAYVLDSPLGQPISRSSLVFDLVLNPQLHTPCISSPSYRHLFAAHAHTNTACSAAISMLCHLHLVSLSAPVRAEWLQSLSSSKTDSRCIKMMISFNYTINKRSKINVYELLRVLTFT